MPRLNARGEMTTGYSICWYDERRMILQDCSNNVCKIVLSDGTPIDDLSTHQHGTAFVYANGDGAWAAFHAPKGQGERPEVFGPDWSLLDAGFVRDSDPVGPDGSVAFKQLYNSLGPWAIRNIGGGIGSIFGGDCQEVQNLGAGRVVWTEGGMLRTRGVRLSLAVATTRLLWWPRVKLLGGDWALLYQDQKTSALVLNNRVVMPAGNYFRPDFIEIAGGVLIAWAPTAGETSAERLPLSFEQLAACPFVESLDTPNPPPPPPPPPMSTPNHLDVVAAVNQQFPHLLAANTRASCGEFTERVALALQPQDSGNWGLVSKSPGEKQHRGHGIDSLKYKPNGQVIDIVVAAGAKEDGEDRAGGVGWAEVASRAGNDWMAPIPVDGDTPPPPTQTHKYDGGGHDTGTCDVCGKSRFDAIHAIPQSKVSHVYDGGEQDTGLCDICQKPKADPIHSGEVPDPGDGDEPNLAEMRAAIEALKGDTAFLRRAVKDLQNTSLPANLVKHGDPVTVKGTVSLFGYSREITSKGTL